MLILRHKQMAVLKSQSQQRLIRQAARHAQIHFPSLARHLGPALNAFIEGCIPRAVAYGLHSYAGFLKFFGLALVYGKDFDSTTQSAWMRDYLSDSEISDPEERIRRLYAEIAHRAKLRQLNAEAIQRFNGRNSH